MGGMWTTVSSKTEKVEDPNPAVWFEAAKNANTYESAMFYYNKAENYYRNDTSGYSPEWFLKEKIYYKFHQKTVHTGIIISLVVLFCAVLLDSYLNQRHRIAQLEAERARYVMQSREYTRKQKDAMFAPVKEQRDIAKAKLEPDSSKKDVNSDTARDAFLKFHSFITTRYFQKAYDILSPDYQKRMKSSYNFSRGYDTTVRSVVEELKKEHEDSNSASYAYKLKAVDCIGSEDKIQYFVGRVKLIKINGQWRIDSTEAKKASENSSLPANTVNATVSDTAFNMTTVGIITGNDVNVRNGPGIKYKSLGFFYKGDKVKIINSSRNSLNETWYKIEFDNPTVGLIVGWVRSDFININ